MVFVDLLVLGK